MPTFMTIGSLKEDWRDLYIDLVAMDAKFKGDVSTDWHRDWINIDSFAVDLKEKAPAEGYWAQVDGGGSVSERREQREQRQRTSGPGGVTKSSERDRKQKKGKENILTIAKPTDAVTAQIVEWTKKPDPMDMQIDCCTTEDNWQYLTLVFRGVTPAEANLQEDPSDELKFNWEGAIVCAWQFDEANDPTVTNIAVFGDVGETKKTTSADDRGVNSFEATPPDVQEGSGVGQAARSMQRALSGGLPPVAEENRVYDQERRRLGIDDIAGKAFRLESFRGIERMSQLFLFDLELRSDELELTAADFIGQEVSWRICDDENLEAEDERPERFFHGLIKTVLVGEMASDFQRRYHVTVVPSVWPLTQRSDCRVYQEMDVVEIIQDVFDRTGFTYESADVTGTYPKMEYCVQYQETDFAFLSRLMESAGISYFFKQEEGSDTMVLCDSSTGYLPCPEEEERLFYAFDVYHDPKITAWRNHFAFVPGKFDSRDWNFTTPREPVKGDATTSLDLPGMQDAEMFYYPGGYADLEQAPGVASRRLQEREVGHHFAHGVGCYDGLAAGMTFILDNPPGEEPGQEQKYLVTGIRHRAEQLPDYGAPVVGYQNSLTCIPEEVPFVPARTTPKPVIYGPQTAIVVGDQESDEEVVDTDKYGRIKIQFHWDRHNEKNTDSSCWVRCAQTLAGNGYGAVAIPRIGWEVVVQFIGGDPDQPLVTGCVYNELHMPPHQLKAAKHKTTLMTRSFPNGKKDNFNELTFHDEKDKEEIYLHAERDFKRVVEHDDVLEIGEKDSGGQTITIEGDQSTTINTGNRTTTIAEGTDTSTIEGDRETTINSGNETVTVSSGDHKLDIASGKSEVSAGQSIELKVGGNSITIDTQGITLKVGSSEVKVDNMGVTMKGMNVKAKAELMAELKGLMTKVSGDGMLQTKGGITMMQ